MTYTEILFIVIGLITGFLIGYLYARLGEKVRLRASESHAYHLGRIKERDKWLKRATGNSTWVEIKKGGRNHEKI
jgi:hypothetical protein